MTVAGGVEDVENAEDAEDAEAADAAVSVVMVTVALVSALIGAGLSQRRALAVAGAAVELALPIPASAAGGRAGSAHGAAGRLVAWIGPSESGSWTS